MKCIHVALAFTLLAGPASAQAINLLKGDGAPKTMDEILKEQQVEEAYKKKLKEIPDQKASSDPWGSVRAADAPKAPAARKAKTQ
jgi:hypothetical protein